MKLLYYVLRNLNQVLHSELRAHNLAMLDIFEKFTTNDHRICGFASKFYHVLIQLRYPRIEWVDYHKMGFSDMAN